jgi:hypothetical protein
MRLEMADLWTGSGRAEVQGVALLGLKSRKKPDFVCGFV